MLGYLGLQASEHFPGFSALRPFADPKRWGLLPNSLRLASTREGATALRYELIRRDDRSRAIYGVLSFQVEPVYSSEKETQPFRTAHSDAVLRPVEFVGGFLRLVPTASDLDIPAALLKPQVLLWNDLGRAGFRLELEGDSAALLAKLLDATAIPLTAYAEMEFACISPPLPVRVSLDPAELTASLGPALREGTINRGALFRLLRDHLTSYPIHLEGDIAACSPEILAEALTNLIRTRLGTFVPGLAFEDDGSFALPRTVSPGLWRYDLSEPFTTRQAIGLTLKLFEAIAQLKAAAGSVVKQVAVPPVDFTGLWPVRIEATVPEGLDATLSITLRAPPTDQRDGVATGLIEIPPPGYTVETTLRLSPSEQEAVYTYKTYCRFPDGDLITDGVERPCQTDSRVLRLGPEDFPLRFHTLSLTDRLARGAVVEVASSWEAGGRVSGRHLSFKDGMRSVTIAVPRQLDKGSIVVTARPRDEVPHGRGGAVMVTLPLEGVLLDLPDFKEYGQHTQTVSCGFPEDHRGALLLEIQSEAGGEPSVVRLTPQAPKADFTWFAPSPFLPGYRFRMHGSGDWSAAQPPFSPLRLRFNPTHEASELRAYLEIVP